jgi:hypothetical protein
MKQLILNVIEPTKNGTLQIKFDKLSSDGDFLGFHRTAIEPGGDVNAQIAAVNAHMGREGFAPLPDEDLAFIHREAAFRWTPENIAPVTAKVQEAIAVQQAAIAEAAAKKLEAETLTAQEIKDAKAREVAANEAKTLAEAAEAAATEAQAKAEAALKAAQDAANALAAQEKAAAEKKAFDEAVAAKVAEMAVA